MCLRNSSYQQRSVFWDENGNFVRFNCPLPSGTKQEDVTVGIDEGGSLLTIISKEVSSHDDSSTIISGSSLLSFLKKKETDTISPIISMRFNLPAGLNTTGFKTEIDDEGLLTLTFEKLVPIHSETPFDLGNVYVKWETAEDNNKGDLHFKAYLPAGTKMEDMMVGIGGRKSLMIGSYELLKKEEGDTSTLVWFNGNNFRSFILPDGVNPKGFNTVVDDAGVLTVTFTKLKPKKRKLVSIAKKMLGCLADAVPAAFVLICDKISDWMS